MNTTSPLLPYPAGCRTGHLVRREKRFSMAVMLQESQPPILTPCLPISDSLSLAHKGSPVLWCHTNNTGSMLGLLRPGSPVLLSPAANPARKLAWTVEALGLPYGPFVPFARQSGTIMTAQAISPGGPQAQAQGRQDGQGRQGGQDRQNSSAFFWTGVNTSVPNRFLEAAFYAGLLPWAKGYSHLKREAVHKESRLDGLCTGQGLPPLWIECKNVTLVEDGVAAFPDAVSARGTKHLGTLRSLVAQGCRAAMLYLVQRPDARCFGPADYVDPTYAQELARAIHDGVEIYPIVARIDPQGIYYDGVLPVNV